VSLAPRTPFQEPRNEPPSSEGDKDTAKAWSEALDHWSRTRDEGGIGGLLRLAKSPMGR
jgi:hypothetical protein